MATKNLNIKMNMKGASQATSKMRSLGDSVVGTIGKYVALGVAVKSAMNFMKDSLRLYGIQEQAEKSLQTALGHTSNFLLERAAALQRVTTYGDEEIIQAQALIAAFVKEEGAIDKATQATLDLAVAKKMDLVSAADLVSKTLGSTTNALSRYGIEVHGAVGSTERLESTIESISKLFGGQAAAQAKTYAGQVKQISNAWGDVKENIGKWIIDNLALQKALDNTNKLLTGQIHLLGSTKSNIKNIQGWQVSIGVYDQVQAALAKVNSELEEFTDWEPAEGGIADAIVPEINEVEQAYQDWKEKQLEKIKADELEQKRMERLNKELMKQAGYYSRIAVAVKDVPKNIIPDIVKPKPIDVPVTFDKSGARDFDNYVANVVADIQGRTQAIAATIQNSLSSAIMGAFENGQFSAQRFFDYLQNAIASMAIKAGVAALISSLIPGVGFAGLMGFGGGLASGGSVEAGTRYLVGESGPEMFVPKQSGEIIPNAGTTINVTFNGNITDRQYVETFILPQFKKAIRLGRA